jgi:hypothetical protein
LGYNAPADAAERNSKPSTRPVIPWIAHKSCDNSASVMPAPLNLRRERRVAMTSHSAGPSSVEGSGNSVTPRYDS